MIHEPLVGRVAFHFPSFDRLVIDEVHLLALGVNEFVSIFKDYQQAQN